MSLAGLRRLFELSIRSSCILQEDLEDVVRRRPCESPVFAITWQVILMSHEFGTTF